MNYFDRKAKTGTEAALDACDFFITDQPTGVRGHNSQDDLRLKKHQDLRHAVMKGDATAITILLQALKNNEDERKIIINMAPNGANTLLFL